jgi:ABC-type lipoprotein release transport system permease subunit
MALGASSQKVTQLMLWQTARPVMYGLVAGAGLAAMLATALLATESGAYITEIVHVTDPIAYGASLLIVMAVCLLATSIPAIRAARVDPMQALRQE